MTLGVAIGAARLASIFLVRIGNRRALLARILLNSRPAGLVLVAGLFVRFPLFGGAWRSARRATLRSVGLRAIWFHDALRAIRRPIARLAIGPHRSASRRSHRNGRRRGNGI